MGEDHTYERYSDSFNNSFFTLQSWMKGIEQFQQALQISPLNLSAHHGLASALLSLAKESIDYGAFKWGASLLEVSYTAFEIPLASVALWCKRTYLFYYFALLFFGWDFSQVFCLISGSFKGGSSKYFHCWQYILCLEAAWRYSGNCFCWIMFFLCICQLFSCNSISQNLMSSYSFV